MASNVAPLKVAANADGTGTIAEMTAQDTIALQNLVTALRLLGGLTPTSGRLPIFTGDNAASVVAISASGRRFDCIPQVGGDGVLEIGQYIDFHETSADTADFSGRMSSSSGVPLWVNPKIDNTARLMFTQHNIVGAVGYSGSYPSGAIVEYGSNANGAYLRLADGTQHCWSTTAKASCTNRQDAGYLSQSVSINWAASFAAVPVASLGVTGMYGYAGFAGTDSAPSTTGFSSLYLFVPTLATSAAYGYITAHAIGRWR